MLNELDDLKYLVLAEYGPTFLAVHRLLLKQIPFLKTDAILPSYNFSYGQESQMQFSHFRSFLNAAFHCCSQL
jgi:hypothetical protein